MRLIDADNLKPDAQWDGFYNCYSAFSISQIDDAPTVQAVPIEVLQEIRQEIAGFRDDAEIRFGHQLGFDKIYAYERCIDLIDTKIKELSE